MVLDFLQNPLFLIALLWCVVGIDLLLVCLQNRLLQLQLRGVGQSEKQIAVGLSYSSPPSWF